jgi:hypothetical protein
MNRLLLLSLLISGTVSAQVKYVEKGTPAPYDGYLFSPDKEQEARQNTESIKYYKLLDESNQRIINMQKTELDLSSQQAALWKAQNLELAKQLEANNNASFWRNTVYFLAGAAITTALAFGVNKATN